MSQDLFAAFGDDESARPSNSRPSLNSSSQFADQLLRTHDGPTIRDSGDASQNALSRNDGHPVISSQTDQTFDDDDDFGDFEDASAQPAAAPTATQQPEPLQETESQPQRKPQSDPVATFPPKAPRKSSAPASVNDGGKKLASKGRHPFADHMDLLFEAGDDEYDAGADELGDLSSNPEAAMAFSKRIIAEQEAAQSKAKAPSAVTAKPRSTREANPKPGPNKLRKKSGYAPPVRKADVLFDAEDVSEHDSEDAAEYQPASPMSTQPRSDETYSSKTVATKLPAIDLLGLDDVPSATDTAFSSGALTQDGGSKSSRILSTPRLQHAEALVADVDDDWDDFESATPSYQAEDVGWDDFETSAPKEQPTTTPLSTIPSKATTVPQQDEAPPVNVPPPIVLLSVFLGLFSSAEDALFDTMSKLDLKQRQALLAHPASHQFLKGYLGHCVALGHIIAGRKLRWKRDQHLSQSMRIGPSAAGGKGGMKLAGLDKSEVAKEDREVVDVLRLWKAQVGKLRSALSAASTAPGLPKLPPVPDLAEQMPVKSLKQTEGGLTAPHTCALCGLKREERVAKVDIEVEDSFGEWWVQGMDMHLVCRTFWEEFEKKLKSR